MPKELDYLIEDPQISSQKYALITIVGPHMKQKCDTWGLKIRGVADSLDACKKMSKKLLNFDNNFDIYNVEVGKFFPLTVEPYDVSNIEYQNDQLNELVKNYLENREKADDHWNVRKQDMMKEAIKEGRNQKELQNKIEHPISVLQRINKQKEKITEIEEQLESAKYELKLSEEKYETYSEEEKEFAKKELISVLSNEKGNIEEMSKEIINENESNQNVKNKIKELRECESELSDLELSKSSDEKINDMREKKNKIIADINNYDSNTVNKFINDSYQNSEYSFIEKNVPKSG